MSLPILLIIFVIVGSMTLFLSGRVRPDLVALLVLLTLAVLGLVSPEQASAGFGSPVVITVCSIFVLSAGLYKAGVAGWLGQQILRFAGKSERQLIVGIMVTAAAMSSFMNTIGIVALMLPSVMDVSRRTGFSPSKLLIPLSFGALLGGLTSLFATLTNLLISNSLRDAGLKPFGLFDFAPVGLIAAASGIVFMATIGRKLLPARNLDRDRSLITGLRFQDALKIKERAFTLKIPAGSILARKSLGEIRLGSILGLHVVGVIRKRQTLLALGPNFELQEHDRLLVQGTGSQMETIESWQRLKVEPGSKLQAIHSDGISFAEVAVTSHSPVCGHTLAWIGFRRQFGLTVLAIKQHEVIHHFDLQYRELQAGDKLLLAGPNDKLDSLISEAKLEPLPSPTPEHLTEDFEIAKQLFTITIPPGSHLANLSLGQSRIGDALGFAVLSISRDDQTISLPSRDEILQANDRLLVLGQYSDFDRLAAVGELILDQEVMGPMPELESEHYGLIEIVLSPQCTLRGKSLREIHFRDRYSLNVLGIWRQGQAHTTNLRDATLELGDVLLLHGPKEKLNILAKNPDFIPLTQTLEAAPDHKKSPRAIGALLLFLCPAILGWLPVHIAALLGAVSMVLTQCLSMESACKAINLKSVLLIAGMLPLGTALQETGAALWLSESLVSIGQPMGPTAVLSSIFIVTVIGTTIMPAAAFVVLMAPIVLNSATALNLSPHAFMMTMAIAAAGSFNSPIAHPANIMIMGPGDYRFADYLRVGLPLTLLIMIVTLVTLPWIWPL